MGSNQNALQLEEVAHAAERCFTQFGVRRTSMKDVANELGVTRQTVHRLFNKRSTLLEYVAGRHIAELAYNLKLDFARFASLEEALVEGSLLSLKAGRDDSLLQEIVRNSDHEIDQFLFTSTVEVQQLMLELWSPLLDAAREDGRVREGISNDDAVAWIRHCHAAALIRDDIQPHEQRKMFENFLVPSIMRV